MIQKIIKVGTSLAVTIPRDFVREIKIRQGDRVEAVRDPRSGVFFYRPVNKMKVSSRQKKIADITLNFINRYRDDLQNLADK